MFGAPNSSTPPASTPAATTDPQFKYVTAMLNSNGTNGGSNGGLASTDVPSFIADASSNNAALTITGDVKPTRLNPNQNGYYSNYFNAGTGSYIIAGTSTNLALGSGDFTVESWVYPTANNSNTSVFIDWRTNGGSPTNIPLIAFSTTGVVQVYLNVTSGILVSSASAVPLNTWTHIAVVRNGTTVSIYLNGTLSASATSSINCGIETLSINNPQAGTYGFFGFISNLRIVKGTAVYTANFTPPSVALTAITNTSLLTCQSPYLKDNSTNAFAITVAGTTSVSSSNPFGTPSIAADYGSAYFDGTGDVVVVPNNTAFSLGTSDFTVEAWVNIDSTAGTNKTVASFNYLNSSGVGNWGFYLSGAGPYTLYFNSSQGNHASSTTVAIPFNTWAHVVYTRTGTTSRFFVNGTLVGTALTDSFNYAGNTGSLYIGTMNDSSTAPFKGYISNFRLVKGTGLYTANFTPPMTPLTAVTNTQLLTLQYDAASNDSGIIDSSSNSFPITRTGNVTQGSFAPFGSNWSNYFNGTSALQTPASSISSVLGTNGLTSASVFTIECWIYQNQRQTNTVPSLIGDMTPTGTADYMSFGPSSTGVLQFYWYNGGGRSTTGSSTIPLNTWTHIALVVNGTNIKLFVNGNLETLSGTTTNDGAGGTNGYIAVGEWTSGGATDGYFGYVSNLRITKSALYSASFTPSSAPLSVSTNTSLLTCQSPSFQDNSANAFALTATGTPSTQRFSPFSNIVQTPQSYSNYFDGVGDYLITPNLGSTTGDFTIEGWFFQQPSINSWYPYVFGSNTPWVGGGGIGLYYSTDTGLADSTVLYAMASGTFFAFTTFGAIKNKWCHMALVRSGSTITGYLNGVSTGTMTVAGTINTTTFLINGVDEAGNYDNHASKGYVSNFRIIKGTAQYTANFTPPTAPLTAVANTVLLTCQDPTIKDNSSNSYTITTNGGPTPEAYNPFGYTTSALKSYDPTIHGGSMYFDGTGDWVTVPTSTAPQFGTGDFTVECWAYAISNPHTNGMYLAEIRTASITNGWVFYLGSGNSLTWYTAGAAVATTSQVFTANRWYHFAYSRSGTTGRLFVDGVAVNTVTDNNNYSYSSTISVGAKYDGTIGFQGYHSNFRVTKGTAIYKSNFVPPLTPVTATPNTQLLLNGTNAAIYDNAMQTTVETRGAARISTTQKKFGTGSMYFPTASDFLVAPTSLNCAFGTGAFTIECWVYVTSLNGSCILDTRLNSTSTTGMAINIASTGGVILTVNNSNYTMGTSNIPINTWTYVTVQSTGTSMSLWVDGAPKGTAVTYSNNLSDQYLQIGLGKSYTGAFSGYIDELRITKGYSRYTVGSSFTPPTAALPTL